MTGKTKLSEAQRAAICAGPDALEALPFRERDDLIHLGIVRRLWPRSLVHGELSDVARSPTDDWATELTPAGELLRAALQEKDG